MVDIGEKDTLVKMVSWSFLVGVIIAVVVGFFWNYIGANWQGYIAAFLAILGLIIGLAAVFGLSNITEEKTLMFLIAALLILGIGATGGLFSNVMYIGDFFNGITKALAFFIAPAAGLISIKTFWDIGRK